MSARHRILPREETRNAAISAMRLYHNYRSVTICAAVISVAATLAGMILSILAGTPVGSTIVAVDVLAFGICWLIGKTKGR